MCAHVSLAGVVHVGSVPCLALRFNAIPAVDARGRCPAPPPPPAHTRTRVCICGPRTQERVLHTYAHSVCAHCRCSAHTAGAQRTLPVLSAHCRHSTQTAALIVP